MFAVIKSGGKQYRVAADEVVTLGKIDAEDGATVTFPVLMLGGEQPKVGAPLVDGASVTAEVVKQTRGDKVIAFKKRRRQNSRRKIGHRQDFTVVRITSITGA
ncbi:50S ribosomal protein L21 [Bosea sp. 117]|uniref:50S ribosomal protein L21 n=1 Tax=Bosea sp. 117 TaxID=1125973 RepID=UPI000493E38F|nr:50S ribosomal protein L21 [Bosea sp. 117]